MPALRSRQQELLVLGSFEFGDRICPLLEIIKEKDRINNSKNSQEIWLGYVNDVKAEKIFIDLPVYIRDTSSMSDEVLRFNRTLLSNIERRIEFLKMFSTVNQKVIPVISSLLQKTRESNTITRQIMALRENFDSIAIRTFTNTFENDFPEILSDLNADDILIYDLDTTHPLNPLVKKQLNMIATLELPYKVALRSAINTEIQNTKLDHGEVVPDADNSLLDVFQSILKMNAFGDYAGIKKDDLNSGGTISPGFIFYDPVDNLYYGFKGEMKSLSEFETTIVPAVLTSEPTRRLINDYPEFVSADNSGYQQLLAIADGSESGKSQAKFKRIAMEHYLHCIKTKIMNREFD